MFFTNNVVDVFDVFDTLSMGRSSTLVAWQSKKDIFFRKPIFWYKCTSGNKTYHVSYTFKLSVA